MTNILTPGGDKVVCPPPKLQIPKQVKNITNFAGPCKMRGIAHIFSSDDTHKRDFNNTSAICCGYPADIVLVTTITVGLLCLCGAIVSYFTHRDGLILDIHIWTWLFWISGVNLMSAVCKQLAEYYLIRVFRKKKLFASNVYESGEWEIYFRRLPMVVPLRNWSLTIISLILSCIIVASCENDSESSGTFGLIDIIADNVALTIIFKAHVCLVILSTMLFFVISVVLPWIVSGLYLTKYSYYVERFLRLENYMRVILKR